MTICKYRHDTLDPKPSRRGITSVSTDVDRLLGPKTLDQLRILEGQVAEKLQSNEPIDEEYWENLLESITVYKAKAQLSKIYVSVVDTLLQKFREQQIEMARGFQKQFNSISENSIPVNSRTTLLSHTESFDPEPILKIRPEDKGLEIIDEAKLTERVVIRLSYWYASANLILADFPSENRT
jgi:hypothetical protein